MLFSYVDVVGRIPAAISAARAHIQHGPFKGYCVGAIDAHWAVALGDGQYFKTGDR